MATLEINFNCLCLFVPQPSAGIVHVLMPKTDHRDGLVPHHFVRLIHPRISPAEGIGMEGWLLDLDKLDLDKKGSSGGGSADTSLVPEVPPRHRETIANLSGGTLRVPPELVDDVPDPDEVVARIILRAGHLKQLRAQADWELNGQRVVMSHRVIWRIENFPVDQPLNWTWIGAVGGEPGSKPLEKVSQLGHDADGIYRLGVFHVTEKGLPPKPDGEEGVLTPGEVKDHFRALYRLFGVLSPGDSQLPKDPRDPRSHDLRSIKSDCPTGKGLLG